MKQEIKDKDFFDMLENVLAMSNKEKLDSANAKALAAETRKYFEYELKKNKIEKAKYE